MNVRPYVVCAILGVTASCGANAGQGEPTGTTTSAITLPVDPNWTEWAASYRLPTDSIVVGKDDDGTPLYACRAWVENSLAPGKTRADWNYCDVGYGTQERLVWFTYQTLVPSWTAASNGTIPPNARPYGAERGKAFYVCRASYGGSVQVGKVRDGLAGCDFGYGSGEITAQTYDVLTNPSTFPVSLPLWPTGRTWLPSGAIQMGTDADGTPLYSCLVDYAGGTHPGKTRADWGRCDISYGGGNFLVDAPYQVLALGFTSTPLQATAQPYTAGTDSNGTTLGICISTNVRGGIQVGKYVESSAACSYGYGGREVVVPSGQFSALAVDTAFHSAGRTFTWGPGQAPVPMMKVSDGFCMLSSISANFDSVKDGVEVYDVQGTWVLQGSSDTPGEGPSAAASCWPWTLFGAGQSYAISQGDWATSTNSTATLNLWGNDSFCWLNQVSGKLRGDVFNPAYIAISTGPQGNTLTVPFTKGDDSTAAAFCANFGNGGPIARPAGSWAETYGLTDPNELPSNKKLASSSDAVCYLSGVLFGGSGGVLSVSQKDGSWWLTSDTPGMQGQAWCISLPGK